MGKAYKRQQSRGERDYSQHGKGCNHSVGEIIVSMGKAAITVGEIIVSMGKAAITVWERL